MKALLNICLVSVVGLSLVACRDASMKANNKSSPKSSNSAKDVVCPKKSNEQKIAALKQQVLVVKSATHGSAVVRIGRKDLLENLESEMQECGLDMRGPICLNHESRTHKDNKFTVDMEKLEARLTFHDYDRPFDADFGIATSYLFIFKLENSDQKLSVKSVEIKHLAGDKATTTLSTLEVAEMTDKEALAILNDTQKLDIRRAYSAILHLTASSDGSASAEEISAGLMKSAFVYRTDDLRNGEDLSDKELADYQRAILDAAFAGFKAGKIDKGTMNGFARSLTTQGGHVTARADQIVDQTL